MWIRDAPHDQWVEVANDGEVRTVLVGRVPEFGQWIKVVFIGEARTGALRMRIEDWRRNMEEDRGGSSNRLPRT